MSVTWEAVSGVCDQCGATFDGADPQDGLDWAEYHECDDDDGGFVEPDMSDPDPGFHDSNFYDINTEMR